MSKLKKAILDRIGDRILKPARIHSVEALSEHFRLIHLESPLFEKEQWRPGQKIQINTGDWNVRTYTPIALDSRTGKLSILAFLHGKGPGSDWARKVKSGDLCQVLGPRPSLKVVDPESIFLFGDETSFALAANFKKHFEEGISIQFAFEVASISESQKIAERFEFLGNSIFFTKQIDHSHLDRVFEKLDHLLNHSPNTELIFTGNAKSIQSLRQQTRERKRTILTPMLKAYWAFGKAGLD